MTIIKLGYAAGTHDKEKEAAAVKKVANLTKIPGWKESDYKLPIELWAEDYGDICHCYNEAGRLVFRSKYKEEYYWNKAEFEWRSVVEEEDL